MIEPFDVNGTSLGIFTRDGVSNANADDSAVFVGVTGTTPIAAVEFSIDMFNDGFAVNRVDIVSPAPATCPADVNGDTDVAVADLLAVLAAWGPCAACPEDIVDDGEVDTLDLLDLLAAWGPCP